MIISLINNNGKVLKTTIATNIANIFIIKNKKVLIIDVDQHSNIPIQFSIENKKILYEDLYKIK